MLGDDGVEGGVDILRHAGGVAADVDAGSILQPGPEARSLLEHLVLHVDLVVLVAGEGEIEMGKVLVAEHGLELVAVEEVGCGAALAEEEPVLSGGGESAALVQEGAEGCDAGAGADHDDGRIGLLRQAKFFVWLNVDGAAFAGVGAVGEQGGADAAALAVVRAIADDGDGGVDFAGVCIGARRDCAGRRDSRG